MTFINTKKRINKKYNSANNLKSTVKEILKKNQEGLNVNQILRKLEELGKYYEGIKEDLRVLLRSGSFEKKRTDKRKIIYKIQDS